MYNVSGYEIICPPSRFSSWCHPLSMFHCPFADCGEVYTWGWKECVPSGKVFGEPLPGLSPEKDVQGRRSSFSTEQGMFDFFTIPCCDMG